MRYSFNYLNKSSWKRVSYILKSEALNSFKANYNLKYKNFKLYRKLRLILKKLIIKKQGLNKKKLRKYAKYLSKFKKQKPSKYFSLRVCVLKRINVLFKRFFLFLNFYKNDLLFSNKSNDLDLLTNVSIRKNSSKLNFFSNIKSLYLVFNKKVYFFNGVDDSLLYYFYDCFRRSSLYFTNSFLSLSSVDTKSLYTKFLSFYFRKSRSRRLLKLRRFWFLSGRKSRLSKKLRLKFKKYSSLPAFFPPNLSVRSKFGLKFRFKKPRFLRRLDLWGFKRRLTLHKLTKVQLGFYHRSKFLQYSKISRLQGYLYSFGLVYDRLYLLFFIQLIYHFINNTIRYFKYVSITGFY